jgi:hypothetical protein
MFPQNLGVFLRLPLIKKPYLTFKNMIYGSNGVTNIDISLSLYKLKPETERNFVAFSKVYHRLSLSKKFHLTSTLNPQSFLSLFLPPFPLNAAYSI